MKIDKGKRNTLKSLGITGVGATAAVAVPGALAAAQNMFVKKSVVEHMPFSGVTVTHYSNFRGHTVLLRNETDRSVTLYKLSPGHIATPDGELDLGVLFDSGELTIPANTTQAMSIDDRGHAQQHASWIHLDRGNAVAHVDVTTQSVNVTGQYDGVDRVSASRVHTASMSVS